MSSIFSGRWKAAATLGLFLILALMLAACGGNKANIAIPSSSPQSSDTEQGAANGSQSSAPEAASETASSTRTVKDAYGETTLPANPQRVVVLNTSALENVLALGIKPVGAPYSISVNANFFKHLASQTEGIENTGTVDQPNLETIAKLAPDLIIGQKSSHDAVYEDLKRIAPVYMTEENSDQWKTGLLGHGDAVNRSDEAGALLASYEDRIATFKTDMGDRLTERTVTLIRPRADHIRIHMGGSFNGSIIAEAGIPRPEQQLAFAGEHHIQITEEQIADMDADVILSFGRETEADYFEQKIKGNPLWGTLKAVQNDEVHMLDWEIWLSGQGIQSANLIIDDLNKIFNP